jgi:hypothetical protein
MKLTKLASDFVQFTYPELVDVVMAQRDEDKELLRDELGDDFDEDEYEKNTLIDYWLVGDFVTATVTSADDHFSEPTHTLHLPSDEIFDAQEGDSEYDAEFWEVWGDGDENDN